jgi:hypothetical protein
MKARAVIGLVAAALAAPAAAASAAPAATSHARCDPGTRVNGDPSRERLGPVGFGGFSGYAQWDNMERVRSPEGTYYAKSPMYVRRRTVASLSIAPAYRGVADLNYGHHGLVDVVRINSCKRGRTTFFSGGIVVRAPACVEIQVRVRGRRGVLRQMVSINKGDGCPAPG